jgi:UV DNA damage endonuclease
LSKAKKQARSQRTSQPRSRSAAAKPKRSAEALKLGFPVKVLAAGGLKSNDTRRWQQKPHLRVSLRYLEKIFDHLEANDIAMYRMSSDLAPYVTHPDMPQFHGMIEESADELKAIGKRARKLGFRLSFHPSQFIVLNSPDPVLVQKSVADLAAQTQMLDLMELGPEAVIVVHAGGTYGDTDTGCARWVETYKLLSPAIRRRLVLENDDLRYSAADVLKIHEMTGVPLIFDHQHFWCHNPEQLKLSETVKRFLATWPKGVRPKIHFSSPRTELRELKRKVRGSRKKKVLLQPPVWTGHADFCQPFEFIAFMRMLDGLEFDVMLEAKSKDLALLRLRRDLQRYAPDVAERFGLEAARELPEEPATIEIAEQPEEP